MNQLSDATPKTNEVSLFRRIINLYTLSILFNIFNLSVYSLVLVASILRILALDRNLLVINSFSGVCCALCIFSELHLSVIAYEYFRFIVTFRGRGALYLILGFIIFNQDELFFLFVTYYSVSAGLMYFIISFVPHLLPLNDLKANYRAYRQHIEELKDPYALPSQFFSNAESQSMAENGNTTIRTSAMRDIHTIRTGYDHNKAGQLLRGKSTNLPSLKGQATLAMEINAALLDIHYADFAATSSDQARLQGDHESSHSGVRREVSFRLPLESHFIPEQGSSAGFNARRSDELSIPLRPSTSQSSHNN